MRFKTFDELVQYMRVLQRENPEFFRSPIDAKFGTVSGTISQFQQLTLSPEAREEHDETMVIYYVENDTGSEEEFKATSQWFDKNSGLAVEEPEWFKDRKRKIEEAREKQKSINPEEAN